jgi:hypothetical protein
MKAGFDKKQVRERDDTERGAISDRMQLLNFHELDK